MAMVRRWVPWRWLIGRAATAHGFIDPVALHARMERFARPSEVGEPIELLRAGAIFHARGLLNTRAIQHNLDWVWPYWIERQFDPGDVSFLPRAFSLTHVNLTHRNWTALGLPDCPLYPLVDPRGLVTPDFDGWSLDFWVVSDQGDRLLPGRARGAEQSMEPGPGIIVRTAIQHERLELVTRAWVEDRRGEPVLRLDAEALSPAPGWMVISLRPANPEGVSLVSTVALEPAHRAWKVDGTRRVSFSAPVDRHEASDYRTGDVSLGLGHAPEVPGISCPIGLATAAAMFRLDAGERRALELEVSLLREEAPDPHFVPGSWSRRLIDGCRARLPDQGQQELFEAAVKTLILLAPGDAYPGPYTYRRFWFRDAAFLLEGLLVLGQSARVRRCLDRYPARQRRDGYFRSQEGEWDSNGEVLWSLQRFQALAGGLDPTWAPLVRRAAEWIAAKRTSDGLPDRHAGLLPAGFSAEHLGPIDHYYWDDFWSVAGLECAGALLDGWGDPAAARMYRLEADHLRAAIDRSLDSVREQLGTVCIPASPYRRLDSGAVGSLAASYPLRLWDAGDPRLSATVEFLLDGCMFEGGFFQDMIHSGVNAYLTLHLAQVLLRARDPRALPLIDAVAALASPTGQWPEAIHPRTGGGCMGDGQHGWAAAEWVLATRARFVLEEDDRLVLGAGIPARWLTGEAELGFGPTPTRHGTLDVRITPGRRTTRVAWSGGSLPPELILEVTLPGHERRVVVAGAEEVELGRRSGA